MPATEASSLPRLAQPYPGLRPFEPEESLLFHGRQSHTEELLRRLGSNRFLAVVGASGSGKSSLVRAGLLPALYRGFLVGATSRWRIAVMRPGNAPFGELARTLSAPDVLGGDPTGLGRSLTASSRGLVSVVRSACLAPGECLLLVVDQFEELIRYQAERRVRDGGDEAALFVASLLEATDAFGVPLYVVLTMRSEYLGECAQFPGLPEALNRSQYLIPRLNREQRREAIETPLALLDIRITPRLVQRLLNDAGEDPDQLPVLQHALMRTFRVWKDVGAEGAIDTTHYEAAGTIARALNDHAETVSASCGDDAVWVERIFRCLTTIDEGRAVRRPARLDRIFAVIGAVDQEAQKAVIRVILRFADRGACMLTSTTGHDFRPGSVIDITHESLIRKWSVLESWLKEEAESAAWYRRLAEDVRDKAGLWRDPKLAHVLRLRETGEWNPDWATQYWPAELDPSFAEVTRFLELSSQTQHEEREREEARRKKEIEAALALARAEQRNKRLYRSATVLLIITFLVTFAAGVYIWRQATLLNQAYSDARAVSERLAGLSQDRENLVRQLRALEDMQQNVQGISEQEAARLSRERDALKARLDKVLAGEERTRVEVQQQAKEPRFPLFVQQQYPGEPTPPKGRLPDPAAQLERELRAVTEERDRLQSQLDDHARQTRDAPYWRSRAEQAEAALTGLRTVASEPVFLALAEYSSVLLPSPPFPGRAGLFVDDVQRYGELAARLYLWTTSPPTASFAEFRNDKVRSGDLVRQLGGSLSCPGIRETEKGALWCFPVGRNQAGGQPQRVGQFRFGATTFQVVVIGVDNALTGADYLSVALYPLPPEARAR